MFLNQISLKIVEQALLKAPVQLALLTRQAKKVTSDSAEAIELVRAFYDSDDVRSQPAELYPTEFDINPATKKLLRGLVLAFNPRIIVETGVANGVSTRALLEAIDEATTQFGERHSPPVELHSLDISESVVMPEYSAHQSWMFHLVSEESTFAQIMSEIGLVDMFLHDSNHAYWNQANEYRVAWDHLAPGGILVSDDVNWSQAFLHFSEERNLKPVILADGAKFVGLVRKPFGA